MGSCREASDLKDLPDFVYASAAPRARCARPGVRSEGSLCRRSWGSGGADEPPVSLKLSPLPVFLMWSCGGRKSVSLLIVTA